jgi:LPXTG-motif cell wall-anchored protein
MEDITVTGIITTYLPYIAMILLAMAALALYVVSKRRRAARY